LHPETKFWTSKYLNNLVEQDHRRVKQRLYPMLSFKQFANASVTISGVELMQKIRKGQFNITSLMTDVGMRVPQIWEALLTLIAS
jgi:transposase-like protein